MKFQILAIAAALTFGGSAAFAAPNDSAKGAASPTATHAVKVRHHAPRHAVRHHAKVVHHAAVKHHKVEHMASRHHMRDDTASVRTDVNAGSRDARMEQALQKYRSHS